MDSIGKYVPWVVIAASVVGTLVTLYLMFRRPPRDDDDDRDVSGWGTGW